MPMYSNLTIPVSEMRILLGTWMRRSGGDCTVISVAAHEGHDPFTLYYNPAPPVEFGAPGIDLRVAWLNKATIVSTGNSFVAPHMAGIVTLIRGKHPQLTPFQIKAVLFACAANTRPETQT